MLRRLDRDRVVDPSFWVGPEVGRDLKTRAERNEHTVGDVALSKTELLRTRAIDFQLQFGRIRDLVQTNVDGAGNLSQAALDFACDPVVLRGISGDLDINRRRQTKIQNLADDVSGLKIK